MPHPKIGEYNFKTGKWENNGSKASNNEQGTYYCPKCERNHKKDSNIGKKHAEEK